MSSSNTANAQSVDSPDEDESNRYRAPYSQNGAPFQDHYIIAFKPGCSLARHFAFVGKEIEIEGTLDEGYYAKLDFGLFETVRRDPGVELIEDNTLGEWGPSEEDLEQARREEAEKERARKAR